MPRPKKPAPEKVVRRPKSERKGLSPELESLARGETDRLFRPHRVDPERVRDPREGFAMKGVANRDARAVYDARLARLHGLLAAQGPERAASEAALGDELCDWLRLELWKARRVTSFRSFAEDVLSQKEDELASLARKGAARAGVGLEPLSSERSLALWLRLEAGLLEADPTAWVRLDRSGRFVMSVALDPAAAAVAAASVRVSPMARSKRGTMGRDRGPASRGGDRSRDDERARDERPRREPRGGDRPPRGGDRPPRRRDGDPRAAQDEGNKPRGRSGFGERHPRKKPPRG